VSLNVASVKINKKIMVFKANIFSYQIPFKNAKCVGDSYQNYSYLEVIVDDAESVTKSELTVTVF
jgi:hypothetical protein